MYKEITKIIISTILFILSFLFKNYPIIYFTLIILSYLIVSLKIFIDAIKHLIKGKLFDENMLMIIATISAFCIGEYPEAVVVMLLFEFGEYLSHRAVHKSKESITKLMDLRSDYVNLVVNDDIKVTDIKKIKEKDIFIVKPGEKVPLDGIVIEGESRVNTSSLTGESKPKIVKEKDTVLSGYVNENAILKIKATTTYQTSTATKIIELIENSDTKKASSEKFITKFARIYTPIVVLLAILITIIPTLLGQNFSNWLYRALVFLVTSCPCALIISIPLGFFCGIGRSSKEGILVKGSKELENLTKIKTIVLDKTGTITKGNFVVTNIHGEHIQDDKLLKLMAYGEYYSNHPIAKSIINKYDKAIDKNKITNFKEISGHGISVTVDNQDILIGNEKLLKNNHIKISKPDEVGTIVYLVVDNVYCGYLVIADEIKEETYELTKNLQKENINNIIILSGDNVDIVAKVCKELNINQYFANLLPQDKVTKLNEIKENNFTAFIGDGINDAPVIKIADVGVAMGGLGSDAAIEASDVVLMHDNLNNFTKAIKIAKFTKKIVTFNIVFAITFKLVMLILATLGLATIWMAVIADVGVTLLAVLNSLRIMKKHL